MPVSFHLSSQGNKAGEKQIRVSIYVGGTRYLTTAGFYVDPQIWIENLPETHKLRKKKNLWVVPGSQTAKGIDASVINSRLAKINAQISEYELLIKTKPTQQEIKDQYNLALGREDGPETEEPEIPVDKDKETEKTVSVTERYQEFIREESINAQWELGTLKAVRTTGNHLAAFGKAKILEYFNEDGINRFVEYLRTKVGLQENSARKQYKNLLWFMNWAIRKGYTQERTIQTYKPRFIIIEKPVIFLTDEELMRLYHYEVPPSGTQVELTDMNGHKYIKKVSDKATLEHTRDCFCFCAFTSLRYSDMESLRRTDIRGGEIIVTTQKTNDRIPIQLNSYAQAILDRYKDETYAMNRALPVTSNQKMNAHIKDICELCGINEPVTEVWYQGHTRHDRVYPKYAKIGTHSARRTFICFALAQGIPPEVVMKWTGHCDYKSMKPYIGIAEKTKADAMKRLDEALKKL